MPDPREFAAAPRGLVIAPAGCGKTELIARAVAANPSRRHLVLTHTHAGVRALRERFRRLSVPSGAATVETVAGWALRYALAYPRLSGLEVDEPSGPAWELVYPAAQRVLASNSIVDVVRATYAGAFVDEYQDCNVAQHALVKQIADVLPCRVVGDPLQGIFSFGTNTIVPWGDVEATFPVLGELATPWRWKGKNEALGEWLLHARAALLKGSELDLQAGPLMWAQVTEDAQREAAWRMVNADGSVVVIHKWPDDCHSFASRLRGTYSSMEEMDAKDLMRHADAMSANTGVARARAVVDFACSCISGVATALTTVRKRLAEGAFPDKQRLKKHGDLVTALEEVARREDLAPVDAALSQLSAIEGTHVYRRELRSEMVRALAEHALGGHVSLKAAAWHVRNRRRHIGRSTDSRSVSRTLLIKGLEFDHAVILDADALDERARPGNGAKNLYVAMTRPSRSLTVLSASPRIRLASPRL